MRCQSIIYNTFSLNSVEKPDVREGEVLVQVKAIGVNRADILQLAGKLSLPDGLDVPGLEISGTRVDNNQRVAALLTSGGYAEYVSVPENHLINIPDSMSFEAAAALPEALAVAELNLFEIGQIQAGQRILIHGGTGGITHILVQIAMDHGLEVYTTTRTQAKKEGLQKLLGSRCHVLSLEDSFAQYINERGNVDLVLDILGGRHLIDNVKSCNSGAKIIFMAHMSSRFAEIDLDPILTKNLTLIGSTLRSKSSKCTADLLQKGFTRMMPKITSGQIKLAINSEFRFEEALYAHMHLKYDQNHIGKVVIKV